MPGTTIDVWDEIDGLMQRMADLEQAMSDPSVAGNYFPTILIGPSGGTIITVAVTSSPPTSIVLTGGAFMDNTYIDATWIQPTDQTAVAYEVELARKNGPGSYQTIQATRTNGTTIRFGGLTPGQAYGFRIAGVNNIGLVSTFVPSSGYTDVTAGVDQTVPAAPTGVAVYAIIRGLLVRWNDNTELDIANGKGAYVIQACSRSDFSNASRNITNCTLTNGSTTLTNATAGTFTANDVGSAVADLTNSGFLAAGTYISAFVSGTQVTLSQAALGSGSVEQISVTPFFKQNTSGGLVSVFSDLQSRITYYARVQAVDASGNGSAWSTTASVASSAVQNPDIVAGSITGGIITAGTLSGNTVIANTLSAGAITTSSLVTATITLNGGSLIAGNPPTTGLLLNSQGLRLYSGGVLQVTLDSGGTASFTGTINASGGSFTGSVTVNPGSILAGGGNTILDNAGLRFISSASGSYDHTRGVKWVDGSGNEVLRMWADSFLNNASIEAVGSMNFIILAAPHVNMQIPGAGVQVGVSSTGVGLSGACYFDSWFAAASGGFTDMHFGGNLPGLGGTNTPVYSNSGANQLCYNTSSVKLKENIVDLKTHDSMSRGNPVWKLRPVWFKWKDIEGEHAEQAGLIAEEAWKHIPGLVHWVHPTKETKLRPGRRKEEMPVMAWDRLHVYLIEALHELRAEIDQLKQSRST